MKPRNVSVSLYDSGNGEIKVWCVSFSLKGTIIQRGAKKASETDIRRKQRQIAKLIESLEIPDEQA